MQIYIEIIEKKRDGNELSYNELEFFIKGYCDEKIPDYQAAALLMAIFLRGMNARETADLTHIMADSGDRVDLSAIKGVKVDKHSTGGVGDKTTLILGPIVASCGIPVAKMSGRGLGHTGGTIDKLEAIPGFKTSLTRDEFISNVKEVGISIAAQTGNLAPADKKLYALRDVTATVNNISLIASSIMSKKIASGADRIVLDVKTGSGAFMKSVEESIELAQTMVDIGERVGRKTVAIVTDMDVPLGNAIGNSVEVIEAIEILKGKGPVDIKTVSLELAAKMLELAGIGDFEYCWKRAENSITDGSALNKLSELITKQGGDCRVIDNYSLFGNSRSEYEVISEYDGYIEHIKTDSLGLASMMLGAGRETRESKIDHSAGILLNKKTGMKVFKGEILARIYTNRAEKLRDAERVLKESFGFSDTKPAARPSILAYVDASGVKRMC
ncbi:pyrimidine-nucleoside phosphorylase [Candidatus Parcubacteria bacterium]|nr:MAG: pyrimidine-nucleoside phosphorylase [Candidatus Parcubacteria bacterium]